MIDRETSEQIKRLGDTLNDIVAAISQLKVNLDSSYITINSSKINQNRTLFAIYDETLTKNVLSVLKRREENIRIAIKALVA